MLRLNADVLAHQNTTRELSLEELPNEMSNFIIESYNGTKKVGEPVLYSDLILLKNHKLPNYYLHINTRDANKFS